MRVKITPRFNTRQLIDETIRKDWFQFQLSAFALGKRLAHYMQNYINSNRKRSGNTGNLANAIEFEGKTGAGFIEWGIGNIVALNTKAPYWYVINYGTYSGSSEPFIPGKPPGDSPRYVKGYFGNQNAPDGSRAGRGGESFTHSSSSPFAMIPSKVRPINYIQSTQHKMDNDLRKLLKNIKRGK